MGKVKVSKEVAEAIEYLRDTYSDNEIIEMHANAFNISSENVVWSDDWECLNKLNKLDLAKILILGYEVEKTPEEKLLAYYRCSSFNDVTCEIVKQEAIERTLDILNIKAKGINC